ncbi:MAG: aminotransferase class I/II-fold pyridoxal phosphate-dependent enzyme [Planctomycetaceae bacterium]|nr:aminotransferase class I/II-fold pyridoxal phosphate-dependent enzyme [Planctomycetaceae bacterium]
MTWNRDELDQLGAAARELLAGFADLPILDKHDDAEQRNVLLEVARRLRDNDPYFHPSYCGQMLKPPHAIARMAYALAMLINPNNHALDGGRASSRMELEAVAAIANMIGWRHSEQASDGHLGHLCGGGTLANFEALWVARERTGGRKVVASLQAHYTHQRLSQVLQLPFESIPVDRHARLDLNALEPLLKAGEVGTVVATLGTTALGAVDPLDELVSLRDRYEFRLHVDAAYGGYFTLVDNLRPETRRAFDALSRADSVVIDPHKHGLQPYGCGCVLFHDPTVAELYLHDSPYTYYTSDELHLGEISLECSRPGAAAVALWATQRLLPLDRGGEFAGGLAAGRQAALQLHDWLNTQERLVPILLPELDLLAWGVRAVAASEASTAARRLFHAAREQHVYLALTEVPRAIAQQAAVVQDWDQPTLTCLRSAVMKPQHLDWLPELTSRLGGLG